MGIRAAVLVHPYESRLQRVRTKPPTRFQTSRRQSRIVGCDSLSRRGLQLAKIAGRKGQRDVSFDEHHYTCQMKRVSSPQWVAMA